jgi:hypothetical protein
MKNVYNNVTQYKLTQPSKALLKAKLDNIAIVPASMLPFTKTLQELVNNLPQGAVFLCHSKENKKQSKIIEKVGDIFRAKGISVTNLSLNNRALMPHSKNTLNF